jgi:hypothetical protein
MYKADVPDVVTVVLGADGFADLLERTEFMQRASDHDAQSSLACATPRRRPPRSPNGSRCSKAGGGGGSGDRSRRLCRWPPLTVSAYARIERGEANPTWTTVTQIARALDVPLARLGDIVDNSRRR